MGNRKNIEGLVNFYLPRYVIFSPHFLSRPTSLAQTHDDFLKEHSAQGSKQASFVIIIAIVSVVRLGSSCCRGTPRRAATAAAKLQPQEPDRRCRLIRAVPPPVRKAGPGQPMRRHLHKKGFGKFGFQLCSLHTCSLPPPPLSSSLSFLRSSSLFSERGQA